MNRARIVILTIAIGAGGVAAYLASGSDSGPAPAIAPVVQLHTVDVRVAKSDIGLGQTVTPNDMQWQTWPAASANNSFILSNIRVFAIDQAPKENAGQNSVVGKTVTLELEPEQVPLLAAARQAGTLSPALRSIANVDLTEFVGDDFRQRGSINVVRYGVNNPTTVQKRSEDQTI